MITNDDAISVLHSISDGTIDRYYMNEDCIDPVVSLACDLGASAIKTIDDMSDVFQKLIMLSPSDIDNLLSFLKTHTVSEIVAILNYLKENNQNDKN